MGIPGALSAQGGDRLQKLLDLAGYSRDGIDVARVTDESGGDEFVEATGGARIGHREAILGEAATGVERPAPTPHFATTQQRLEAGQRADDVNLIRCRREVDGAALGQYQIDVMVDVDLPSAGAAVARDDVGMALVDDKGSRSDRAHRSYEIEVPCDRPSETQRRVARDLAGDEQNAAALRRGAQVDGRGSRKIVLGQPGADDHLPQRLAAAAHAAI